MVPRFVETAIHSMAHVNPARSLHDQERKAREEPRPEREHREPREHREHRKEREA